MPDWTDNHVIKVDLVSLANSLCLKGEPFEALRREAAYHRLAVVFHTGLPGVGWMSRCDSFAQSVNLRVINQDHRYHLKQGKITHPAFLILPVIHAGLVNCHNRDQFTDYMATRENVGRVLGPPVSASTPGPSSPGMLVSVPEPFRVPPDPPTQPHPEMVEVNMSLDDSPRAHRLPTLTRSILALIPPPGHTGLLPPVSCAQPLRLRPWP